MRGIKRKNWLNNSRCLLWLGWAGEVGVGEEGWVGVEGWGGGGGGGGSTVSSSSDNISPDGNMYAQIMAAHLCN